MRRSNRKRYAPLLMTWLVWIHFREPGRTGFSPWFSVGWLTCGHDTDRGLYWRFLHLCIAHMAITIRWPWPIPRRKRRPVAA